MYRERESELRRACRAICAEPRGRWPAWERTNCYCCLDRLGRVTTCAPAREMNLMNRGGSSSRGTVQRRCYASRITIMVLNRPEGIFRRAGFFAPLYTLSWPRYRARETLLWGHGTLVVAGGMRRDRLSRKDARMLRNGGLVGDIDLDVAVVDFCGRDRIDRVSFVATRSGIVPGRV